MKAAENAVRDLFVVRCAHLALHDRDAFNEQLAGAYLHQLDEVGTVYYVIVPAGSPAPTSANLRGHVAGEEDYAEEMYPAACGSIAVSATYANTTKTVQHASAETYPECDFDFGFYGLNTPAPLDGSFYGLGRGNVYCEVCPRLRSEAAYDIYIVAEDDGRHGFPSEAVELQAEPNLQASPTKVLRVNYPPEGPSVTLADVTAPAKLGKNK